MERTSNYKGNPNLKPAAIQHSYTEDEVKAARVLLDQEAADKVAADKVVADKKAADQKSGNDKFLALGLTQDEATALTGYAP